MKYHFKQLIKTIVSLVLIVLFSAQIASARSSGITGRTKKFNAGCNGNNCHGNTATVGVSVMIMGPDTITVGQTANYSVMIMGGPAVKGGTNIATSSGTLTQISATLKKDNASGELTHNAPASFSGGNLTFQFSYKAPATAGTQTIFATGNSVNGNGQPSGDQWNYAENKIITVVPLTTVEERAAPAHFLLLQNYPNPFNPKTSIDFSLLEAGNVTLKVYTLLGEEIVALIDNKFINAGIHETEFDGNEMESGVYIYKLSIG